MTSNEFKNSWTNVEEPLSPLTPARLDRFGLQKSTVDFLVTAGLPIYCQPHLRFANDTDDIIYGITKLTDQFDFEDQKKDYDKYVVIGSCCDGDAIAIDTDQNDIILQLDHGNLYAPSYFNSSIHTLADFLILNRDFEKTVTFEKKTDTRWLKWNFKDEQFNNLKQKMEAIDPKAVTDFGFWNWHLAYLDSARQDDFRLLQ